MSPHQVQPADGLLGFPSASLRASASRRYTFAAVIGERRSSAASSGAVAPHLEQNRAPARIGRPH
jgi:hypothetical protein